MKKRSWLSIFSLFILSLPLYGDGIALPPTTFTLNETIEEVNADANLYYFIDSTGLLHREDLDFSKFLPWTEFTSESNRIHRKSKHWFWIRIENSTESSQELSFSCEWFLRNVLYVNKGAGIDARKFGINNPMHDKKFSRSGFATRLLW